MSADGKRRGASRTHRAGAREAGTASGRGRPPRPAPSGLPARADPPGPSDSVSRGELAALALILALGVFLRVYRLGELPPGLHQDEGVYGLNALGVTLGQFRIYFGEREPLYMYLVAGMAFLVGPGPLALRLTSALVGSLAVLTTYLAARSLFGRRTALLAGATIAVALWPVMVSRLGYRAGTLPLLEPAALYFLWDGWRRGSRARAVAGGALLGATLYTYLASRFFPVALAAFLLAQLVVDRSFFRRRWTELGLALAAALVALAPLGYYFWRHPEAIYGRPSQVAAVDSPLVSVTGLRELAASAVRTVGMFFVAGDGNWRHNLPGETALVLPISALLALGYALALARLRRPAHLLLVIWLPAMLLPSALAVDAPHYLRTIGAAPAAAVAAGLGLDAVATATERLLGWAIERAKGAPVSSARLSSFVAAVALAVALAPAAKTFRDYQVVWASRPETYRAFNVGLAAAGQYLAGSDLWRSGRGTVYVTSEFSADRASLVYFLWPYLPDAEQRRWGETSYHLKWFDEARTLPMPPDGESLYITSERPETGALLQSAGLAGETVTVPPLGLPAFGVYRRLAQAAPRPEQPLAAKGREGLDLIGYRLGGPTPSGQAATLALYWRVSGKPPDAAPSVFCHLLDDAGRTLAADDQVLGYAPAQWAPGDTIVTWHRLAVPPGVAPGSYGAEVGLYDRATGRRQQLWLDDRGDSRTLVGPVEVTRGQATPADVKPAQRADVEVVPGLRLLGYDQPANPVAPGARVPLTLYWQAAVPGGYLVELGLRDPDGRAVSLGETRRVGGRYPAGTWQPGEVVRESVDLRVEPATPAGAYLGLLRVLSPDGGRVGEVALGPVQLVGQPRVFDPPAPRYPANAAFGDVAELVGYDLEAAPARPGGKLKLTLYWRAAAETSTSYTVFAHLIDGSEGIWGQQDNPPARGARPTTGWVRGEYVADEYELPVSPEAAPGEYRVEVGLYDPTTSRRLSVRDQRGESAGDRVVLEPAIRVQR